MIAAIVKDNVIINTIVLPETWNGTEKGEWQPPSGVEVVMLDDRSAAGIGHVRVNNEFMHVEDEVVRDETISASG